MDLMLIQISRTWPSVFTTQPCAEYQDTVFVQSSPWTTVLDLALGHHLFTTLESISVLSISCLPVSN